MFQARVQNYSSGKSFRQSGVVAPPGRRRAFAEAADAMSRPVVRFVVVDNRSGEIRAPRGSAGSVAWTAAIYRKSSAVWDLRRKD